MEILIGILAVMVALAGVAATIFGGDIRRWFMPSKPEPGLNPAGRTAVVGVVVRGRDMPDVVVALVERDGKFLMVRRLDDPAGPRWVFPGGRIEAPESESAASAREVFEETGVHCRPRLRLGDRQHPRTAARIAYWVCDYEGGEPAVREPDRFDRAEWMEAQWIHRTLDPELFPPLRAYLNDRERQQPIATRAG